MLRLSVMYGLLYNHTVAEATILEFLMSTSTKYKFGDYFTKQMNFQEILTAQTCT